MNSCWSEEDDDLSEIEAAIKRGHTGILQLSRELSFEQLDLHRPDGCYLYEECLKYACAKNWKSWSCIFCSGVPGIHFTNYSDNEIYGSASDDAEDWT